VKKDFIDDLARTLATPMPRRGALRTMAAALAIGAFEAVRPRRAAGFAGSSSGCPEVDCGNPNLKLCCVPVGKYGGFHSTGCCGDPGREDCCIGPNDSEEHPNPMSWCCPKGTCAASWRAAPQGCLEKRTCKSDEVVCGKACCKSGQSCCGGNGTCCDPATTYCCREPGDAKSPGLCCKKGIESCCGVGPDGAQTRMCCPKPNKCVKQLPPGKGGFTTSSPWVCCPPAQQVPVDETKPNDIVACCAPGQVSLGGKLLVGQGIQGSCCDEDKICGSGANLTCCQTGQSCIGGTTCA
jgi:hypothetical protein